MSYSCTTLLLFSTQIFLTLAFPPRATSLVPTIPKLGFLAILSDILRKWDKIKTQLFWQSLGASNFYHYIWWKILKSETASLYWPKQKHQFSEILKIFRLKWTLWVTQLRYNHESLRKKMPRQNSHYFRNYNVGYLKQTLVIGQFLEVDFVKIACKNGFKI